MKKILALFLALLVILPLGGNSLPAEAAGAPSCSVEQQTAQVGESFTVPVSIQNNTGIILIKLNVHYDETLMELTGVEDTKLLGGYMPPSPTIKSPYTLIWSDGIRTENNTANGTVAVLTFKAKETSGTADIKVEFVEAWDCNGNEVKFADSEAAVTIEKKKTPVTGVTLDSNSLDLEVGKSAVLTAAVAPAGADNKNVTWKSSNSAVATVTGGTVTAVKPGSAKITVTTEDGSKTAECTVTVTCGHATVEVRGEKAATETETGYTGDTYCKVCGQKLATGNEIPKLAHVHAMVKTKAVAATCDKDGNVEYYTCTKCNKIYADADGTQALTDVKVKASGHKAGAWKSDADSHWQQCTVCGQEMNKAAHELLWVVDQAATEDETGLKHQECKICGRKKNEGTVIDKQPHQHTGVVRHDAVAATCTSKGTVEYYTCSGSKCEGKYYSDEACQIALDTVETEIDKENHSSEGTWSMDEVSHSRLCACGETVDAGEHVYEDETDKTCDICGYVRFTYRVTGVINAKGEASASYEKASSSGVEKGITFTIDGDYRKFLDVLIDKKAIDSTKYTVAEGSTVVTLCADYLNTLSAGDHVLTVRFSEDKSVTENFKLTDKPAPTATPAPASTPAPTGTPVPADTSAAPAAEQTVSAPKTGENGMMAVLMAAGSGICTGTALCGLLLKKKHSGR